MVSVGGGAAPASHACCAGGCRRQATESEDGDRDVATAPRGTDAAVRSRETKAPQARAPFDAGAHRRTAACESRDRTPAGVSAGPGRNVSGRERRLLSEIRADMVLDAVLPLR